VPDVKLTSDKGSMEKRIADRLKNSGGGIPADVHAVQGSGPTRVHHNVHHASSNHGSTTKTANANSGPGSDGPMRGKR
jgi:hypothetical protein